MCSRGGIAAIVWAPSHRHVEDYARRLDASFYPIHFLLPQRPLLAPIKYIPQCLKTWWVLLSQRPSVVYVFISPVFAALSVYVYCWLARLPFIMDVGGQALISPKWKWSGPLVRFLAQRAMVNILDHPGFQPLFEAWGANVILLERPPLPVNWSRSGNVCGVDCEFIVTLISSFADDEPIEIVLRAAERLPGTHFFIMGDTGLAAGDLLSSAPCNVSFTGYLTGDDFWELLDSSQAVMGLTTAPNSLLSAAIEGMTAGKPLILSRQPILESYFEKGTVFIDHSPESIVAAVQTVQEQEQNLVQQIRELAAEKREKWEIQFRKLQSIIIGSDH